MSISRSLNTWGSSMSGNPEFVVPVLTDGSQAETSLREQRESLHDILASTADVVLATDSARPLVSKLQLGNDREQTDHALEISEARYRRLFETAQDAILILDGDTGKIVDANPFLRELLGYSPEELLGKELWQIGLFQDIEASRAAFRQLQEKGYIRYEDLPLETKYGLRREVEFVSNVYKVNGLRVIQCNIRDISDRKRAEGALQEADRHKDQFLATLAHELRNPLGALRNVILVLALAAHRAGRRNRAHHHGASFQYRAVAFFARAPGRGAQMGRCRGRRVACRRGC